MDERLQLICMKFRDNLWNLIEEFSYFLDSYDDCIFYPDIICDKFTLLQRKIYKPVKLAVFMTICLSVTLLFWICFRGKKQCRRGTVTMYNAQKTLPRRFRTKNLILPIIVTWLFLSFFIGFIVEYVRLYQVQNAKKMATLAKSKSPYCEPESMSTLQKIWHYVWDMITWQRNDCSEFYEALVVDPFWEVTPPVVMMSLLTRTVVTPLHELSTSLGISVHNFMQNFPVVWQAPAALGTFALISFIISFIILLYCQYKISFPLFSIEPTNQNRSMTRILKTR